MTEHHMQSFFHSVFLHLKLLLAFLSIEQRVLLLCPLENGLQPLVLDKGKDLLTGALMMQEYVVHSSKLIAAWIDQDHFLVFLL